MKICKNPKCKTYITNRATHAKFCSKKCMNRFYDNKRRLSRKIKRNPYIKHKKKFCEFCGFKAIHSCQLDVDHIDGNHDNNDLKNLQTLCANCHRLKTQVQRFSLEDGLWLKLI